jgi:hypothetical protein
MSKQEEIADVIDQLTRGPAMVMQVVKDVPAAILKLRPAPGVWSAHEHACHLPAVQPLFRKRLTHMLTSANPVIHSYEPSRDDPEDALLAVDLDEAMQRFATERAAMIDELRRLTPAQWKIEATHDEYATYSVFIMFRHLALHDIYHAYRIEERLLRKEWS